MTFREFPSNHKNNKMEKLNESSNRLSSSEMLSMLTTSFHSPWKRHLSGQNEWKNTMIGDQRTLLQKKYCALWLALRIPARKPRTSDEFQSHRQAGCKLSILAPPQTASWL